MPHGTDSLLLQMFTIFVWAKVFGELFERLRLPAVLGEILAGVALGPYATRFILPGDTINSIAEIGAVFLLFTVGLETSPSDLIRVGRLSLRVAVAGIILPFAMGFLFLRMHHEPTHEAIFVAAAMVATSVGITARVLRDMNVHKSRTAQIILGAAVFDDILGMLLLGVLVSTVSTGGIQYVHLGLVSAEAVGFALFMIYVAPRVVDRLEPGIQQMQTQDAPLVLALALCLGLSVAATRIGMAAIIGAFFAGLAFADYSPRWNLEPRAQAINQFLAPFFFFTMGSRLDLSVFSRSVVMLAMALSALAVISKIVGCGLPLYREGWRSMLQVGVGMTPRGEVALIVALIGLQMNMISQRAYALVIVMTAVTTVLPAPFLRMLFIPGDKGPGISGKEEAAEVQISGQLG
ncbi:MAG TPA: cation:proton antiporter [Candidatus Saccharimonadales bacterium]|nr:cation:proton antiporter [Candidatus Saccharimonadales bacterium]